MAFIPQGQAGLAQALAMMQQPGGAPPQQQFQAQQQLPQPMQPAASGYVDPATIQRRQQLADMLRANAQRGGNPRTSMEAIGNLAQTLSAAWIDRRANKATERNAEAKRTALVDALAEKDPMLRAKKLAASPDQDLQKLGISQLLSDNEETYGVAPQFIRQPDGSVRAVQFGNRGTIKAQDAGGVPVPIEQRWVGLDQGQQRIKQAYDLAQPEFKGQQDYAKAIGKAEGEAVGQARVDMPSTESSVAKLTGDIDRLLTGDLKKGRQAAFGALEVRRVLPIQERIDAQALVAQINASLALENVAKLKGPLSDKDIAFLKEMSSRLSNPGISDAEAEKALKETKAFFGKRVDQVRARAGAGPSQKSTPASGVAFDDAEKERRYQEWKARQK